MAHLFHSAWPGAIVSLFQQHQPAVFDLLMVNLCARRLCFFLASRTSAYLLTTCGEAACFSDFDSAFGSLSGSNPSIGVVLIFFLLDCLKLRRFSIFLMWTSAIDKPMPGSIDILKPGFIGTRSSARAGRTGKITTNHSCRSQRLSTVHTTRLVTGRDGAARWTHGL